MSLLILRVSSAGCSGLSGALTRVEDGLSGVLGGDRRCWPGVPEGGSWDTTPIFGGSVARPADVDDGVPSWVVSADRVVCVVEAASHAATFYRRLG